MPKTKTQKEKIVQDLADNFRRHKAAVFVDFRGLNNKAIVGMRKKLRDASLVYKVAKKTLLRRALKETVLGEFPSYEGEIAAVFGFQDEVTPAKLLYAFKKNKEYEKLQVLGGILENKFIASEDVAALAKLPSKDELLGRLVGTINAPAQNFVYVLNGNISNFVRVLHSISQRSQEIINNR